MRFHRSLLLLLLAAAASLFLGAQPAAAEEYPASPPVLTTPTGSVGEGGTVTITGSGYIAGEAVTIYVAYGSGPAQAVATVTADSNGNISATVTLTQQGTATISAVGNVSNVSASVSVTVLAEGDGGSSLPVTGRDGSELFWQVGGGVTAVLLGAGLVLLANTRRRRVAA